jgi:geranylgeranyl pyrophosphate synthase
MANTCHRVASAIDDMVQQVGVYFQIRDDYENLNSAEASPNSLTPDIL